MQNPYEEFQVLENDMNDFSMPYRLYGKTDKETMIAKYHSLTNQSKNLLFIRPQKWLGKGL